MYVFVQMLIKLKSVVNIQIMEKCTGGTDIMVACCWYLS